MIFVSLGTQKLQFNRLLRLLDEGVASGTIRDEIVAQIGNSDYEPQHFRFQRFLGKDDFEAHISKADVVVSHSGVGAIMAALQKEKPVVVLPRLAKYREHVDDHQKQIASVFAEKGYVLFCDETDDLPTLINKAYHHKFNAYISHTDRIVKLIEEFLVV